MIRCHYCVGMPDSHEIDAEGRCVACGGTGVHPHGDDPHTDDDACDVCARHDWDRVVCRLLGSWGRVSVKRLIALGIHCCPDCGFPAHATECDDTGRCATCRDAAGGAS